MKASARPLLNTNSAKRHTMHSTSLREHSSHQKKQLYISLLRSHLSFCSQVWKPQYVKDIQMLERIQRRATKYILNNYSMDYKSRLTSLHLLPISLWLDLHDLLFLVKCLQDPDDNIEINRFITFRRTCTRAGSLVPRLLCVGGEKRAWYTLFAHAQFSQDFWEFGNYRKICSVTLTSARHADFSRVRDACH